MSGLCYSLAIRYFTLAKDTMVILVDDNELHAGNRIATTKKQFDQLLQVTNRSFSN